VSYGKTWNEVECRIQRRILGLMREEDSRSQKVEEKRGGPD
jgi:hypothetical protein